MNGPAVHLFCLHRGIFFHDLYYYCFLICDVFCMDTIMDFFINLYRFIR
ncbi:hypothetical protein AB01_3349 [Escherichia coli 2-177-06_S1_C1]|nr:hypothetical protein ECTHROOPD_3698 [Escherichia coli ThroopD]EMW98110.1 hypothetical protein ECP03047771_3038 [Escherichia coli P0304777.1]ENE99438.1 hypothetical protein ECP03047775_2954 [Escherichia coli P0304777.5]ENF07642.1 hypothetical protein ECP03047778_3016 [Escherichia coli P0304777.8]EZK28408.1 hypothetical protein AB12_3308 [Escherichia coli 1-182-04_S1_C1]KDA67286.1 hypothetical protein AB40_3261 [Escherichia coli 1-182-04_S1_C2]KDW16928.1 hypothetical protein AB01_3349 [Esche